MARDTTQAGVQLQAFRADELGNSSYLLRIPDADAAIVVDPLRDVEQYLTELERQPVKKLYALETHIHNDFISGARELAAEAGAVLGASAAAELEYPYLALQDSAEIALGPYRVRVLSTPGHTPEHVSYLLVDEKESPAFLFSGGALMVGTAARTDLLGPALARPLARQLYHSIHDRLMTLPDPLTVLPTHGGGSFCATGAGTENSTTIGAERLTNPLVLARSLEEFMERSLDAGPYPAYYRRMRAANRAGVRLLGRALPRPPVLSLEAFDRAVAQGAAVIDLREPQEFSRAHIPGSYGIALDDSFSAWVGWLLGSEEPLVFIAEGRSQVDAATRQLLRINFDNLAGVLDGGVDAWQAAGRPLRAFKQIEGTQMRHELDSERQAVVLDVREDSEWQEGHIPGAVHIPLWQLPSRSAELPSGIPLIVHCAHGYRSSIASSVLERAGFPDITHVMGGYDGWVATRPPEVGES